MLNEKKDVMFYVDKKLKEDFKYFCSYNLEEDGMGVTIMTTVQYLLIIAPELDNTDQYKNQQANSTFKILYSRVMKYNHQASTKVNKNTYALKLSLYQSDIYKLKSLAKILEARYNKGNKISLSKLMCGLMDFVVSLKPESYLNLKIISEGVLKQSRTSLSLDLTIEDAALIDKLTEYLNIKIVNPLRLNRAPNEKIKLATDKEIKRLIIEGLKKQLEEDFPTGEIEVMPLTID